MDPIFTEMDTRLSVITRWVVVNTIKKQSVAEHCFNVERIARRIAMQWFGIQDAKTLDTISQIALHHDDDEAVTGDIPSPAKNVLSEAYLDAHRDLWYNAPSPEREIVKLADKMEAYIFLSMETALGNSYIQDYRNEIAQKIINWISEGGFDDRIRAVIVDWLAKIRQMRGRTHGWVT